MRQLLIFPRLSKFKSTLFDEFFSLDQEESASPFLMPSSRSWATHLTLKASVLAATFLSLSFTFSFFSSLLPLSHLFLVFVYFFAGIPALIESVEDLVNLDVNIDVLMTLAAFSSVLIGSSLEGALLLVLFALSGSIEDSVTAKARGSLSRLHKLSPTKATVINAEGHLSERSVKDISLGTPILIRAGEIVPLDGKVIEGISSVNLVHLTGENLPVTKKVGDEVAAGARNLEGTLTLHVTHTNADSTLTKIIQLVTHAQESRPLLQRWFDRLSRGYALTIISLSTLFALTLPHFFSLSYGGPEGSVYRALAFLIAASPCALILAIPIAYLSALSACAQQGILLKGGVILDSLAHCSVIAFDKTGTLTTGLLSHLVIENTDSSLFTKDQLLAVAYALEKNVVHPIAQSIVNEASHKKLALLATQNFRSVAGYGVEAQVYWNNRWEEAFMGKPDYLFNRLTNAQQSQLKKALESYHEQGSLVSVLFFQSQIFIFAFQDTVRFHLKETLASLKKEGWNLLMLTGDHLFSAQRVAKLLGIDAYHANLTPADKLDYVTQLAEKENLVMIGDGINDAPALARATVGICMGKIGSDTAIDAADVIFLQDDLDRLNWLMKKAKQTQKIVRQNLFIAAGAIVVASLPALAGFIPLWLAVIMHEGGTVLVGLNALRLLR